jgi:hypothetical protein
MKAAVTEINWRNHIVFKGWEWAWDIMDTLLEEMIHLKQKKLWRIEKTAKDMKDFKEYVSSRSEISADKWKKSIMENIIHKELLKDDKIKIQLENIWKQANK